LQNEQRTVETQRNPPRTQQKQILLLKPTTGKCILVDTWTEKTEEITQHVHTPRQGMLSLFYENGQLGSRF